MGRRRDRSASPSAGAQASDLPPAKRQGTTAVSSVPAGLGDLAKLKQQLAEERSKLQRSAISAKQGLEAEEWEHEYYKPPVGQHCGPQKQYALTGELGQGVFATVYACKETTRKGGDYAVKFVRKNAKATKQAENELSTLRKIQSQAEEDPEGSKCILQAVGCETFVEDGHLAMVFPVMKCDLRAGLTKYGQGNGLPMLPTIRNFARDIFLALRFLRAVDIIHGDLKPDNLLISMDKCSLKLCDFGGAMDMADRSHTDYLQPRFYRAPEVILGQSYNTQIDLWSAGATLYEAATDRILFNGSSNNEMIHEMLQVCGAFPKPMLSYGGFLNRHFNKTGSYLKKEIRGKPCSPVTLPMSGFAEPAKPIFEQLSRRLPEAPRGMDAVTYRGVLTCFADLVTRCLVPDPDERLIPEDALQHKFIGG